jgi:two-component system, NtrC family, nitrogen regulation response regulator GlnG
LQTHVRILTATNQDLDRLTVEGRFRKDLYYRLKVVTIRVPPLRERLDDIAELAHYFLFRFNRELRLDLRGFAPETLELLQTYPWPGNVRELQSTIKQAMLNASGHILLPEFLPKELHGKQVAPTAPVSELGELNLPALIESLLAGGAGEVYRKVIEAVECELLPRVLRHTRGHQAQASAILGLHRATLRHKLRSLGFAPDKVFVQEPPAESVDLE